MNLIDKKGGCYIELSMITKKSNLKNGTIVKPNYSTMDKKKLTYEIIKIICTAIISIAAVLTAQSCTMSLSVSKNNSNSTQKTEQTTTSSVDSTQVNINQKNKNHGLKRSFQNQKKDAETDEVIITIGNHLATEQVFKSEEEAQKVIDATDWNLVTSLVYALKEADEWEQSQKRRNKLCQ